MRLLGTRKMLLVTICSKPSDILRAIGPITHQLRNDGLCVVLKVQGHSQQGTLRTLETAVPLPHTKLGEKLINSEMNIDSKSYVVMGLKPQAVALPRSSSALLNVSS